MPLVRRVAAPVDVGPECAASLAPGRPAVVSGRLVAVLSVVFVPVYASGFLAGKIATAHMPVPTVLLWRFVIALAVAAPVALLARQGLPRGRAWLHLGVTAVLLQLAQFSFVYTGFAAGVPAGLSSLIIGLAPLLVGLATPLVLATRLGAAPLVGLLIGACGVYIVVSDELGGGVGGSVVLPVLGMLSLAAGTLYQKRFNDDTPVATSVSVQMLTSLVVTAAVMPFLGVGWLPVDAVGWWTVAWLGVVNSAGAFALMFLLLQWRSTVYVSSLLNLVPATTALCAVPVVDEPVTAQALLGLCVALVGMYVGLPRRRRHRDPAERSRRSARADPLG